MFFMGRCELLGVVGGACMGRLRLASKKYSWLPDVPGSTLASTSLLTSKSKPMFLNGATKSSSMA